MPIRGLDQYIPAKSQQRLPLKVLNDTIIAIDGFWYLKRYLVLNGREALLDLGHAVSTAIDLLVTRVENTQILWVWDGLEYARTQPPRPWGSAEKAAALSSGPRGLHRAVDDESLVDTANAILRAREITVVRAPYAATAQLVYFLHERCVTYIFTKTDALLFESGTKIIVDFNFSEGFVETIDRGRFFNATGFNLTGFQAFGFLCGCELCPTVPSYATEFSASQIAALVRSQSLEEHLHAYLARDGQPSGGADAAYLPLYYRAFVCVDFHPVMSLGGRVVCLNGQDAPSDLSVLFGRPLNSVLYQELFLCNISPRLLKCVAWGKSCSEPLIAEVLSIFSGICGGMLGPREDAIESQNRAQSDEEKQSSDRETLNSDTETKGSCPPDSVYNPSLLVDTHISSVITKLLKVKITRSSNFNRLIQTVFLKMQGSHEPRLLLELLNAGSSKAGGVDPSKLSTESYCFYDDASAYIRAVRDLSALITVLGSAQNDMAVVVSYADFLRVWGRAPMLAFIRENIPNEHKLVGFLDILK